ncbi:hypothetical protein GC194_04985 [bacterium]|nr:hypothetical protein [bacterium]
MKGNLIKKIKKEKIYVRFENRAKILAKQKRYEGYEVWLDKHPDYRTQGYIWSSIQLIRTGLKKCHEQGAFVETDSSFTYVRIQGWIDKAETLIPIFTEYLKTIGIEIEQEDEILNNLQVLRSKDEWFLYYYYKHKLEPRTPVLTRNGLILYEGGEAHLVNNSPKLHHQYRGEWSLNGNTIVINLINDITKTRGYSLYVKDDNEDPSLLYGTFNAYNSDDIFMGFVILERVTEKIKEELGFTDLERVPHSWKGRKIPQSIIDFLSYDSRTFGILPHIGNDLSSLQLFNNRALREFNIWKRKFLGEYHNEIVISDPNNKINFLSESYKKWKNSWIEKGMKIKVLYGGDTVEDGSKSENGISRYGSGRDGSESESLSLPARFEKLYRSKFFIYVLSPSKSELFLHGVMELAWSMIFCDHLIIVYDVNDEKYADMLRTVEYIRQNMIIKPDWKRFGDIEFLFNDIDKYLLNHI